MSEKISIEELSNLNSLGIKLTDEYVFRNHLGWNDTQIKEYREMQIRDADQRYNLVITETNGATSYNNKLSDENKKVFTINLPEGMSTSEKEKCIKTVMNEFRKYDKPLKSN